MNLSDIHEGDELVLRVRVLRVDRDPKSSEGYPVKVKIPPLHQHCQGLECWLPEETLAHLERGEPTDGT